MELRECTSELPHHIDRKKKREVLNGSPFIGQQKSNCWPLIPDKHYLKQSLLEQPPNRGPTLFLLIMVSCR